MYQMSPLLPLNLFYQKLSTILPQFKNHLVLQQVQNKLTPIVTITNTISTADAQESLLTPAKKPLEEEAQSNRLEGSNDN